MRANLNQPLSLTTLARAQNISTYRLAHLFREEIGTAPMQYLRWLRLEAARELLKETSLSVKEITFKVGIKDKNHFRREFRRLYRVSPTAYRKTYQDEKR